MAQEHDEQERSTGWERGFVSPSDESVPHFTVETGYHAGAHRVGSAADERADQGDASEVIRRMVQEEMENHHSRKAGWRAVLLVLAGAVLGAGGGAALVASGAVHAPGQAVTQPGAVQSINVALENGKATVENAVAQKAVPSIVGITTISEGMEQNPFLYGIPKYTEAVGSGVIVSSDGYILTNAHVVNSGKAQSVKVLLSTDEEIEGKVLWADATLDLAVVKIEKKGLPAIEFGDATQVHVGDKAIAIGNPLGLDLQSTLTSGYVSGLDRSITLEDGNIMDGLIQTDAAINGGNSGGALLDAEGKLIGLNSAKPEQADGIGFAIPVSTVKPIVDRIVKDGTFQPLYLGITGYNAKVAMQMGLADLPTDQGVVVRSVTAGSPAADAGIASGDVIVAIDGKNVLSMNGLKTLLLNYKSGDQVTVTVYSGEKKRELPLTFSDFSPEATLTGDAEK